MRLIEALMNQDYTREEALEEIAHMRDRVLNYAEDPDEVLYEYGLEPDYVMEILYS
jgi:hypothetical protein